MTPLHFYLSLCVFVLGGFQKIAALSHSGLTPLKTVYTKREELLWVIAG